MIRFITGMATMAVILVWVPGEISGIYLDTPEEFGVRIIISIGWGALMVAMIHDWIHYGE